MPIPIYLAMTSAEFLTCTQPPTHFGWMACHFSPGGEGLCNLPQRLPPGSLLILDDSTPYQGHDLNQVLSQLENAVSTLKPDVLLLDFQRVGVEAVQTLTKRIIEAIPCPVIVSACYADDSDCPIFLPPPPLYQSLDEYLTPYRNREIWLDAAPSCGTMIITTEGAHYIPQASSIESGHFDKALHCHYTATIEENRIVFTFARYRSDIPGWLAEAEKSGVTGVIGLYQELQEFSS